MSNIEIIVKKMRKIGFTEKEIEYAVKPLKIYPEVITKLLNIFDDTPLTFTLDIGKLRKNN